MAGGIALACLEAGDLATARELVNEAGKVVDHRDCDSAEFLRNRAVVHACAGEEERAQLAIRGPLIEYPIEALKLAGQLEEIAGRLSRWRDPILEVALHALEFLAERRSSQPAFVWRALSRALPIAELAGRHDVAADCRARVAVLERDHWFAVAHASGRCVACRKPGVVYKQDHRGTTQCSSCGHTTIQRK